MRHHARRLVRRFFHDLPRGRQDVLLVVRVQIAIRDRGLRHRQGGHEDIVVNHGQIDRFKLSQDDIRRFVLIAGRQSLEVHDLRFERRLISQYDIQELQCGNVFAQHEQAGRQRPRENQADRPP